MDQYQQYIHISRYSRWLDSEKRRETWAETVGRYFDFFNDRTDSKFYSQLLDIEKEVVKLAVMPSMRCLMAAGPALERENIAGFNCAYLAVNTKRSFAESLYILMCGTGVGFSCERQEIADLPKIPKTLNKTGSTIVVSDSKKGWAKAFHALLSNLWNGDIPNIDYSKIRPAGERLKTFGGRASGPDPLAKLFNFAIETFQKAKGRRLNSLEVHDLMCTVGEIVVVGGVRRSALISLSNLSDQRMRDAKSGDWRPSNPQRELANNSVAYTEKPEIEMFMDEWISLVKSKSGERGIFNREAAQKQAARWGRRAFDKPYGCNPCSEIILLIRQFCNLTEVIIRKGDTLDTLLKKVEIATILGTLQATLTDFDFLSEDWKINTEAEALLGVSLTGIMDNDLMSGKLGDTALAATLNVMRNHARAVNKEWSDMLGINPSAAITCVKPSGTVSQLCDTASGIHARHSKFYIRRTRLDKKDPIYAFMVAKGFTVEDVLTAPDTTATVSFPIEAPDGAIMRDDRTAIEQLDLWLLYQREWCEHKPSVSISVKDDEWLEVGAWVYKNFDEVSGISFFPSSDHIYDQAPYEELDRESFEKWVKENPQPTVDWADLAQFEEEDNTVAMQTLACAGGSCELD